MKACVECGSDDVDGGWACTRCGFTPSSIDGFLAFAPELAHGDDAFEPGDFAALASMEADNFWFLGRNALLSWAASHYFGGSHLVHEAGCGTGFVLCALAAGLLGATISGSELLSEGLIVARGRVPGAELIQADIRHLPFRDEFDLIGAFDVLEHIDDDRGALEGLRRAAKPGGGLLLTVPQHPRLWSDQDVRASHRRRYTREELTRKVTSAGFSVVRVTSFVSLLLPAMLLNRRKAKSSPGPDAVEALSPPFLVDRSMRAVMRVERGLIQRGISFPFGGSLLLVARRPA